MDDTQYLDSVRFFNDQFDDIAKPKERWSECTRLNLPKITKDRAAWTVLKNEFVKKERAVVIVGASPRLKEDVQHLKNLDGNFYLIVVNSALKLVLENGIRPDLVVMVDANDRDMVKHLDTDTTGLTLLTTNASSPKAIAKWKGDIVWCPYYVVDKKLERPVRNLLGKKVPSGGNALTYALSVAAHIMGARIFITVGNELCYDQQYYADKKSKWEKPNVAHFLVKDVLGRDRYTNIPLFQYKMWLEKFIDTSPHINFIDTSRGIVGTDTPNAVLMDLPEAIEKVKEAFKMKDVAAADWKIAEKMKYDHAYTSAEYRPDGLQKLWKQIFRQFDMSRVRNVLEVGCGIGQGVAVLRNAGFEAWGIDIAETIKPYWDMGNITQFCKVAPAHDIPYPDDHFDLVTCFDVLEHIPPEGIDETLADIRRVGNGDFLLGICITPAENKLPSGIEPHMLIRDVDWWLDKLASSGFNVQWYGLSKAQSHLSIGATKGDLNGESDLSGDHVYLQRKG